MLTEILCPCIPTGRGNRLRTCVVSVRIRPGVPMLNTMMKANEIITQEMTMRMGSLDNIATSFVNKNKQRWFDSGKHIGDIDEFTVKSLNGMYSMWDAARIVACSSLDIVPNNHAIVDQVWVDPEYRGKKLFSKLLWFFKTRMNCPKLLIGDIHSSDMQQVIAGLSRFKKSWINISTGEVKEFSPETADEFSSWGGKTKWRLMLENEYDFSDFPRFTTGNNFIKEAYDWQIE